MRVAGSIGFGLMATFAIACGDPSSTVAPPDAGADAQVVDAGPPDANPMPDPNYPAKHPSLPIVDYMGGPILDAPEIVTITFDDDPLDARIRAFGDAVGASAWWDVVRAGYCVPGGGPCIGTAKHVAHVVLPALEPAQAQRGFDDGSDDASPLKNFLRLQLLKGAIPQPGPETLYMLFVPANVPIRYYGILRGCHDFTGYHGSAYVTPTSDVSNADPDAGAVATDAGANLEFAYAVLARCTSDEANLTRSTSHELIEAATDPHVDDEAFYLQKPVWSQFLGGGEVGDLCVDVFGGDTDTVVENGFTLQRVWSNDAVRAMKTPCVPAPPGDVYFNTAPQADQLFLKVGAPTTIELDGFSDAPLDDWSVSATDVLASGGLGNFLSLSIDRRYANNGVKLFLTIEALGPTPPGSVLGAPMVLRSTSGSTSHAWPMSIVPM